MLLKQDGIVGWKARLGLFRWLWLKPGLYRRMIGDYLAFYADGEPVKMDAVWGAVAEGERVRLLHAVVYDRNIAAQLANTLFDGVKP